MNESYIKNVVEAAMLAAGRPLQVAELAELFDEASRPAAPAIRAALASLEEDYAGRGIEVKETATGFRIQVRRDVANEISRLWPERPPKYSRALLETLALIAYRQPITRAEIEAVRGVAVNPNIIKTLLERTWVRVVGNRDVPGRPELLGTTKDFLDYFGLRSLDELPPLAELKAMGDVNLQLDLTKDSAAEAIAAGGAAAVAFAAGEVGATDVGEAGVAGVVSAAGAASEVRASSGSGDETGERTHDAVAGDSERGEVHDAVASAAADTESEVDDDATVAAMLEAAEASSEGTSVETSAVNDADGDVDDGSEDGEDEREDRNEQAADDAAESREAGPQRRAAEAFVAELESDDDADGSAGDDDAGDDDELSADSEGSGELVAGPRDLDD